jgi:hypothetical protein
VRLSPQSDLRALALRPHCFTQGRPPADAMSAWGVSGRLVEMDGGETMRESGHDKSRPYRREMAFASNKCPCHLHRTASRVAGVAPAKGVQPICRFFTPGRIQGLFTLAPKGASQMIVYQINVSAGRRTHEPCVPTAFAGVICCEGR